MSKSSKGTGIPSLKRLFSKAIVWCFRSFFERPTALKQNCYFGLSKLTTWSQKLDMEIPKRHRDYSRIHTNQATHPACVGDEARQTFVKWNDPRVEFERWRNLQRDEIRWRWIFWCTRLNRTTLEKSNLNRSLILASKTYWNVNSLTRIKFQKSRFRVWKRSKS